MKQLDDEAIAQVAQYFRVLSEPTRLKVLNALREHEMNVGEIADMLECTTANASKHLSLLAANGFLEKTVHGNSSVYRIADPAIFELCDLVCGQVGQRLSAQARLGQQFAAVGAPPRAARSRRS